MKELIPGITQEDLDMIQSKGSIIYDYCYKRGVDREYACRGCELYDLCWHSHNEQSSIINIIIDAAVEDADREG